MLLLLAALSAARPFHLHESGRDIDFRYDWVAEASAIPSLRRTLMAQKDRDRLRSAREAGDERRSAAGHYPFHRHEMSRTVRFAGQSARLASFNDMVSGYTGGAHPNSAVSALLWDRSMGRTVSFAALFASSPRALIQPAYCAGLAGERKKKGMDSPPGRYWEACPDPLTLAVIPTDADRNGRFERLEIVASPYAVGSYAEGYYNVTVPVSAALVRALKPGYRSSFEPQRQ